MPKYSATGTKVREIGTLPAGFARLTSEAAQRIATAVAEVDERRVAARTAHQARTTIRDQRRRAEADDREALADAIRAGRADPGAKAVSAWAKAAAESVRKAEGELLARDRAEADLAELLASERPLLEAEAADAIRLQESRWHDALDALNRETAALVELRGVHAFVASAGRKSAREDLDVATQLVSSTGRRFTVAEALAGIRRAIDRNAEPPQEVAA